MNKLKISNKELRSLGIKHPEILMAIGRVANRILKQSLLTKEKILEAIGEMVTNPDDSNWSQKHLHDLYPVVKMEMKDFKSVSASNEISKNVTIAEKVMPFPIYGIENIEAGAVSQMEISMRLPIALQGALMPDAHEGYGLPIGGVLATSENTVIPYAVGVDIACRMCLSVFPVEVERIDLKRKQLRELLFKHTVFGVGATSQNHLNPEVFDKSEWSATKFIRQHRDLAYSQLGTSGAGNHFVEWGVLNVQQDLPEKNLPVGSYLALLSHSGSRGFGNEVASFYSKIAMDRIVLPREARHLAWLDLKSQEGQEYWIAMTLAGQYASANHHEIHGKISKDLGLKPISVIENHHNFAWKETLADGRKAVVHRKGATPANAGAIGVIPGSMTHPGFVVRGKGNILSLNSASHGAGRRMSRSQAIKAFSYTDLQQVLEKYGVELIGGDTDEIPMAYKNIHTVMNLQQDLVEVIAKFQPFLVRMADPERRGFRKR